MRVLYCSSGRHEYEHLLRCRRYPRAVGTDAPGGEGDHTARLLLRNDAVLDAAYQVDHFVRTHFDTRVIQWRFAA